MANVLRMADQAAIIALWQRGWSQRRIARETGFDRSTVARYVRLAWAGRRPEVPGMDPPKPAISTPGSIARDGPDDTTTVSSNPAISTAGSEGGPATVAGRQSLCESLGEIIEPKLAAGLSAQRIWQDLTSEHGFAGSYQSVKRFCRRMRNNLPLPFRRMECEPGTEAQVDFGTGVPVVIPDGEPLPCGVKTRRRKTHVFRIVLSHSRKAYSEVVYRQTTDDFIRCIENAFHHFGGVPQTLVIDNLKAAVTKADWFDPELNPKIQSFCRHYGTVILPTKPRTPRHKGKTERGIDYVQENALKGRKFASLAEQNRFLVEWERQVADTRIHGTTRKQVKKAFEEVEKPALLALPVERFPLFAEAKRKVNRDGHVEVAKAYYSVPPEYLGRQVWARWDGRTVRVFNHRFEQIAYHLQLEAGQFSTNDQHIPRQKRSGIEQGATKLLRKIELIGVDAGRWAEQMIACRGIEGVRVLMGLLSLANKHESQKINEACQTALTHGAYRLRTIRELIKRQGDRQERFTFIQEHPIIRSLSDYQELVHTALTKEPCS
jgi:transposase